MALPNFESFTTAISNKPIVEKFGLDPAKTGTPDILYTRIVFFLTWGLSVVALLVLIYGGMLYMTAGGEAEKAEKGKKTIVGAIIGIVIIMISYTVYNTAIGALKKSGEGGTLTEEQMREQLNKPPNEQPD